MSGIRGIGFDLFGTLVLQEHFSMEQSVGTLFESLLSSGLRLTKDPFVQAYRDANRRLFLQAAQDGRETHHTFWVAEALRALGHGVEPGDPRIEHAVAAYFEPFIERCHLIPGAREMLAGLAGRYRLGLLSNFTHPPALYSILDRLEIRSFFTVILISGSVGIRKPHPAIFRGFIEQMGIPAGELMYVGDDPQADIVGARQVGMHTVWMTYRQQLERPSPLERFLEVPEGAEQAQPDHVIRHWSELVGILTAL